MHNISAGLQRAHNPEVVCSNPAPATKYVELPAETQVVFFIEATNR